MLAKRLAIAFLLEKGYSYAVIGKLLRVSSTTVHFVNLKKRSLPEAFTKTLRKFLKREEKEEFLDELEMAAAEIASMISGFRKKHIAEAGKKIYERKRNRPF